VNFDPAFIVTHGMHITKQQWKTTTKQRWKKKEETSPHHSHGQAKLAYGGPIRGREGERPKIENTEL